MIDKMRELLEERRSQSRRKLRRQPKMRRVEKASRFHMPQLQVPGTARKRRRRNSAALRLPTAAIKQFLLTPRWISLFLLAICGLALFVVGMDESFYLTVIPVEGAASIPPAEIVESSGLAGVHIFSASPREAAEKIGAIPGVISATVALEWPNSATIRIKEETPIAVWEQGGQRYWVNSSGDLVPARVEIPGLLHIISDVPSAGPAKSGVDDEEALEMEEGAAEDDEEGTETEEAEAEAPPVPFVPDEVLQGALALRELRPNIGVLHYEVSGGLSFDDGRGWRVYFGAGPDMAQKLAVYETLVEQLLARQQRPVYISVSNEEKPFYLANE